MRQVYDAAMRVHRTQERIRELKALLEECEPVKSWRDDGLAMALGEKPYPETPGVEPQFCAKRVPLRAPVTENERSMEWDTWLYLKPRDIPAFIAEHWCPACQRNSPKVVEIRALKRALASQRGTLTKMCRKAAKGGEG
jgi:hypothetical protein